MNFEQPRMSHQSSAGVAESVAVRTHGNAVRQLNSMRCKQVAFAFGANTEHQHHRRFLETFKRDIVASPNLHRSTPAFLNHLSKLIRASLFRGLYDESLVIGGNRNGLGEIHCCLDGWTHSGDRNRLSGR
jgi:hypothetical protein